MTYLKLEEVDVKGKKILVRVGMDMPVDEEGNITDDKRIRLSLPTIRYLLDNDAKQIILMCHIDRPKEPNQQHSTKKTAERLSELLGKKVVKIDDWGENGLPEEKIVFLENVRFNKLEKDKDPKKRDLFGKQLASLADLYVQDAFSNCHHPEQASMSGPLPYIPGCLGKCPQEEISIIENAMQNPEKPLVSIIGGLKAEKLNAVKSLLDKVDHVIVGGGLAFTLFKSMGKEVGSTKVDKEGLENLKELVELIKSSGKVILPTDAVIADKFSDDADTEIVDINHMREGWMALDIGPKTVEKYIEILRQARTIFFNGPVGVYESKKFSRGTQKIVEILCNLNATVVVGGGDSADAVKRFGDPEKLTLVSSGGGASLTMIEGKKLGAITALEENYEKFKQ